MRATGVRTHTGNAGAVDGQIEGVLAAAGGGEPGVREGAHTRAVEDLQYAVERFAFGAGEGDARFESGRAGHDAIDRHARGACICNAVPVRVLLSGVPHPRTVVACVADAVRVAILLPGLRDQRAVVGRIAHPVAVGVRAAGTGVTRIAHPVPVAVCLPRIGYRRTVVASVSDAVAVAVLLAGVRHPGAVVRRIADAITVAVDPGSHAVVTGVADAVA